MATTSVHMPRFGWLSPAIGNRFSGHRPIVVDQDTGILPTALPHFHSAWLADHLYLMGPPHHLTRRGNPTRRVRGRWRAAAGPPPPPRASRALPPRPRRRVPPAGPA